MARGKRKFYPEFYTDEELTQMRNREKGDTSEESDAKTAVAENGNEEENVLVKAKDSSERESDEIESQSQDKIANQADVAVTSQKTNITEKKASNSRSQTQQSKQPISKATGTRRTASKTNKDSNSSDKSTSSNSGSRSNSKKASSKDIDDVSSESIKGKLKRSKEVNDKTDMVFKRIEAMQKDYISQKLNTAKSDTQKKTVVRDDSNADTNIGGEATEVYDTQQTADAVDVTIETDEIYNDYPFDDEPYKMVDMAEMIMSKGDEPYNDSPYELANDADGNMVTEAEVGMDSEIAEEICEFDEFEDKIGTEDAEFEEDEENYDNIEALEEYVEYEEEYEGETEGIEDAESMEGSMEAMEGEDIDIGDMNSADTGAETDMTDVADVMDTSHVSDINIKYGVPENIVTFDIQSALRYAHRWALDRNPKYLDFDELGGDCTNYISQILLAGGIPMDNTPTFGWYYIDGNNKSPAWTGVEQLYKFLVRDKDFGIFAREIDMQEVEAGDIVQLSFNGKNFQHTPFVVSVTRDADGVITYDRIKICAHSFDSENRPLDTYKWKDIRFIRVFGYTLQPK